MGQRGDWIRLDDAEALRAAGLGHLADDAPYQQCSKCGRKTWDRANFEGPCGMPQPDGSRCDGGFGPLADEASDAEYLLRCDWRGNV